MKQAIVITSIFEPTEAVRKFSKLPEHDLVVAGDRKTPEGWSCPEVTFLSVAEQEQSPLGKSLPYDSYCRKMCGYIRAMEEGAELIIDTDDDNIPYDSWGFPAFQGDYNCLADDLGHVNIYQLYSQQKIWPRGLPLNLVNTDFALQDRIQKCHCNVGVWQGLADGDPDVDAIYRLTRDDECVFSKREPLVLGQGTLSPFNSQNTAIVKPLFPLLYLPCHVTFRFTDILRGWVAQPLLWLHGYRLGFTEATVYQDRNPHDYMSDFVSELPMYTEGPMVPAIAADAARVDRSLSDNLFAAYHALEREKIVTGQELETLEVWLRACQ